MKAHDLARALLAGPNVEVAWEDATGNDGETSETRPYVHRWLTVVEGLRVTSDSKIVVVQTQGDILENPDYQG